MMNRTKVLGNPKQFAAAMLVWLVLALSFGLNIYLLFLQPVGVLSLRRLVLSIGLGVILSAGVWVFCLRCGLTFPQWWQQNVLQAGMWRAGLLLSGVLHLIYPAPPAQLFAPTLDLDVEVRPLTAQPAEFRLVSLNNGMVDVSYPDIRVNDSAEIRQGSGIHFGLVSGESARFGWSGRVWRTLTVVFSSDQPVELLFRIQNREERLRFDQPQTLERKISLPAGGWWYYGLVKAGVLLLAGVSLAVLAALLRLSPVWEDG
jgi:hypothetical protein